MLRVITPSTIWMSNLAVTSSPVTESYGTISSNIDVQVFAVIFICNTYRLDIVSVSEVSCVEPYLMNKLITLFLSVLVLIFSLRYLAVLSA